MVVSLADLEAGSSAIVTEIRGGHGLRSRLDAMGIRSGIKLKKKVGFLFHGPVIVEVGGAQIALGFGMARKVLMKVEVMGKV